MQSNQTAKNKSKREQWRQIFSDWKHSKCKTKVDFCRQSGISIKSFYRWRSVFARESLDKAPVPTFAKVSVLPEISTESGIRINLPHDMHITVATGFDVSTLQRVLGVFK